MRQFFILSLCVNCIRLFLCDNALYNLGSFKIRLFLCDNALYNLGSYKMLCFNNNRIKVGKVDASKMHLSLPEP